MRVLNGTDSRVFLGAWAKGRSSFAQLNNIIRRCPGRCILFSPVLAHFWLDTKQNPADDPSRRVPVRAPTRATGVAADLARPESNPSRRAKAPLRFSEKLLLEIFAGCAGLSRALIKIGLECGTPFEAYPKKGVYVREHDLLDPAIVSQLLKLIYKKVYACLHFGMPCSSFCRLQHLNGGTRTTSCPAGDNTLDREILGNNLADIVSLLCRALHDVGCYYSNENPRFALSWLYLPICL